MKAFEQFVTGLHSRIFRMSGGRRLNLGGHLLLLHSKGAKSGKFRLNPLVYVELGPDSWAVAASSNGAQRHPGWFFNVKAQPEVEIEMGSDPIPVRARITEGRERDELYARFEALNKSYTGHAAKASRAIPVLVFTRR